MFTLQAMVGTNTPSDNSVSNSDLPSWRLETPGAIFMDKFGEIVEHSGAKLTDIGSLRKA